LLLRQSFAAGRLVFLSAYCLLELCGAINMIAFCRHPIIYRHSLSGLRINHGFSRVHFHRVMSTLSVWHKAAAKVPPKRILPTGHVRRQKLRAFLGDKLLGAAFARWIHRRMKPDIAILMMPGMISIMIIERHIMII
jgi:hypothetical protein